MEGFMLSDILGIIGVAIGVASFGYALYQTSERKKLAAFTRAHNWHLYSKASNANGTLQQAIAKYKAEHSSALSADVIEWLSKSDAFSQDVLKDIVRSIQHSEPKFAEPQISGWVTAGKVSEHHAKEIFRKISIDG